MFKVVLCTALHRAAVCADGTKTFPKREGTNEILFIKICLEHASYCGKSYKGCYLWHDGEQKHIRVMSLRHKIVLHTLRRPISYNIKGHMSIRCGAWSNRGRWHALTFCFYIMWIGLVLYSVYQVKRLPGCATVGRHTGGGILIL